jgi:hypothetical protein
MFCLPELEHQFSATVVRTTDYSSTPAPEAVMAQPKSLGSDMLHQTITLMASQLL